MQTQTIEEQLGGVNRCLNLVELYNKVKVQGDTKKVREAKFRQIAKVYYFSDRQVEIFLAHFT